MSHRWERHGWKPDSASHEDHVKAAVHRDPPNRLWFCDNTQPRVRGGWAYCAAVIDAFSRRIVGWSVSDAITTEFVVDALAMARSRCHPDPGTVVDAGRGAQYFSWLFGHRLRQAGLFGSMGRVASRVDNALIASFWSTMQHELLARTNGESVAQLASAMFEWIGASKTPTADTPPSNASAPPATKPFTPTATAARSTQSTRRERQVRLTAHSILRAPPPPVTAHHSLDSPRTAAPIHCTDPPVFSPRSPDPPLPNHRHLVTLQHSFTADSTVDSPHLGSLMHHARRDEVLSHFMADSSHTDAWNPLHPICDTVPTAHWDAFLREPLFTSAATPARPHPAAPSRSVHIAARTPVAPCTQPPPRGTLKASPVMLRHVHANGRGTHSLFTSHDLTAAHSRRPPKVKPHPAPHPRTAACVQPLTRP
ncbi:transposase [Microbacterium testaceum]|uniref:transposase n=1 Tax=Microbacterium testaceum TaxID=2033 RepID=UPI0034E30327